MSLAIFDLLMRGGAIALALFTALALVSSRPKQPVAWASIAAALGCSGYLIENIKVIAPLEGLHWIALFAACPAYVWWLGHELLETGRWPRLVVAPLALFFVATYKLGATYPQTLSLHVATAATLQIHLLYVAISGRRGDLVEARRALRLWLVVITAFIGLIISGFEIYGRTVKLPEWLLPIQAAVFLAIISGYAVWQLRFSEELPEEGTDDAPKPTGDLSAAEQAVLDRLNAAMAEGAWRSEGLTIGALADQLKTSEHRLRKVINQGLGHRNFAQFVNGYRVREAQARLADPAEADTSVLVLAHDVGFASLGPFNRAFRAVTGESPSAFRARSVSEKDALILK